MAATTTIRVSRETRDVLKALSARRGSPAGEIVAELARAADEDLLLSDAQSAFQRLAGDPEMLAAYRRETRESEGAFEAPAPDW